MSPIKPTTEEQIEAHKDELWDYPPPKNKNRETKP